MTAQPVKQAVIVSGKGTEMNADKPLHGKAKRKTITQSLIPSLVDVVKAKGDINRIQPYWNTYHCQSKLISANGRLYGNYCKNRFCIVCSSIRKAQIMNRYLPVIDTWEDSYFVTITAKSVPARSLAKRMKDMNRGFRKIND